MTSAATRPSRVIAALAVAPLLAAFVQGSTMAHDDWIQTSAISWSGGVRVASGDVSSSSAPAAGDEHEFEYEVVAGNAPQPPQGSESLSSAGTAKETEHQIYMNAIQNMKASTQANRASPKLAQFAINGNALGACRVGTRYPSLRLFDGRGRWQLRDVAVVRCDGGRMTVSYASRQAR
jgi:hypothetical protein